MTHRNFWHLPATLQLNESCEISKWYKREALWPQGTNYQLSVYQQHKELIPYSSLAIIFNCYSLLYISPFYLSLLKIMSLTQDDTSASTILVSCKQTRFHIESPVYQEVGFLLFYFRRVP